MHLPSNTCHKCEVSLGAGFTPVTGVKPQVCHKGEASLDALIKAYKTAVCEQHLPNMYSQPKCFETAALEQ